MSFNPLASVMKSTLLSPPPVRARFHELYARFENNPYVFASPLGPTVHAGRTGWLPRFVFFGPHASDESWHLALLGGIENHEPKATLGLLSLIEHLSADAESGHGLNLTFFPLVTGSPPEIQLLAQDARQRRYHGFVQVESDLDHDDAITVEVHGTAGGAILSPDVELIASSDFDPLPVRFATGLRHPAAGPLQHADDLGVPPFGLTLRIPAAWPEAEYRDAVRHVLSRFLRRYRAFQAYGGQL